MAISRVQRGFVPMLGREPLVQRAGAKAGGRARGATSKGARPPVEFLHQDGTPVDPGLHKDIVFVKAEASGDRGAASRRPRPRGGAGWWTAVEAASMHGVLFPEERRDVVLGDVRFTGADVDKMLTSLVPARISAPAVEVDAGFFHRTLSRWLGLDSEPAAHKRGRPEPLWDYDFWKAVLHDEGELDEGDRARLRTAPAKGALRRFTAEVFRGERSAPERYSYWIALDDRGRIKRSGWLTPPPDLLSGSAGRFQESPLPPDVLLARGQDGRGLDALYADVEEG